MKNVCRLFFALIFSSGCSDFYHLHYHKLNKIPASGEVSGFVLREEKEWQGAAAGGSENICLTIESENKSDSILVGKDSVLIEMKKKSVKEKRVDRRRDEIRIDNFKKDFSEKRSKKLIGVRAKIRHEHDHHVLIVIGLLFLGAILFSNGIALIILGIFGLTFWMFLTGMVLVFLGILPLLGLISMIVGDRFKRPEKFEEKERKGNSAGE
jgi:hypothetical protein